MLNRVKKLSPFATITLLSISFIILIFFLPFKGIQYGDFGLMYIQVHDIVKRDYSTFSIQYEGEKIDPEYKYFPYKKPFLGKVGAKYYIDFPPYFPLLNAPFYQFFGVNGLYILNFISLLLTLFLIYKLGQLFGLDTYLINICLLLYSFGMTATMYNVVFHEYPLAIFLITYAIYFASKFLLYKKNFHLVLFGLLGGISLFFRLEMIFVIIATGLALVVMNKKDFLRIGIFSILGFVLPFAFLMFLNFHIHGHPLGLRYLLTLTDNVTPDVSGRLAIIYDMLFSNTRGLFFQSPFLLILLLLIWIRSELEVKEKFLFIKIGIAFVFILLTSPNHGDHRAPRYLFGIYPLFCLLSVACYSHVLKKLELSQLSLLGIKITNQFINIIFWTLIIISLFATFQNFKWMQRAVVNIESFNSSLSQIVGDRPIIFRDYGQPLNAQNLYINRKMFVAEKDEDLISLLENAKKAKESNIFISQIILSDFSQENKDKIRQSYERLLGLSSTEGASFSQSTKYKAEFLFKTVGKNQILLLLNIFLNE